MAINLDSSQLINLVAQQVLTQRQLAGLLATVDQLLNQQGQTPAEPAKIFPLLAVEEAEILQKIWTQLGQQTGEWHEFWSSVKESLIKVESSQLYLCYKPNLGQLEELSQLLRTKLGADLILKLHFQPELSLGFVLEHQGRRYDYSLDVIDKN